MAATDPEVVRTIQGLGDEFAHNFNAGNLDQLVDRFYAEEAYLLPPNHPLVRGRREIRDFLHGMRAAGVGDLALETAQVDVSGDLAYRVGTFSLGRPAPARGKFLEVYRRQADGSWKAVADMFSSDQPGA
jgi:ketosteroid isomerase-like protein